MRAAVPGPTNSSDQIDPTPRSALEDRAGSDSSEPSLAPDTSTKGAARGAEAPSERSRVTKLPAVESLRVPSREDTGGLVGSVPQGSPADALTTSTPPVSFHSLDDAPELHGPHEPSKAPDLERGRRRAPVRVLLTLVLLATAGTGGLWWQHSSEGTARDPQAGAEQALVADALRSTTQARIQAVREDAGRQGWTLLTSASEVLGASQGRVDDDAVRAELAAAIEALTLSLRGEDFAQWAELRQWVSEATTAVQLAQGAWEEAEAERAQSELLEAERVEAEAAQSVPEQAPTRVREHTTPGGSGAQPPAASPAPAPAAAPVVPVPEPAPPAPAEEPVAVRKVINPGRASSDGTPGQTTVTATTSGISGPVYATVAGVTVLMGTGSGSFSATLTGLPAGEHHWSITADGLTAHGTSVITVF